MPWDADYLTIHDCPAEDEEPEEDEMQSRHVYPEIEICENPACETRSDRLERFICTACGAGLCGLCVAKCLICDAQRCPNCLIERECLGGCEETQQLKEAV